MKKPTLDKMNLKLDFSKQLNTSNKPTLNLAALNLNNANPSNESTPNSLL